MKSYGIAQLTKLQRWAIAEDDSPSLTFAVSGAQLGATFGLYLLLHALSPPPADLLLRLWSSAAASLAMVALALWLLHYWSRVTPRQLGLGVRWLGRDLVIGLGSFAILCWPIFALEYRMSKWFPSDQQHPAVDALFSNPTTSGWLAVLASAVIAAPLAEEFLFRGLLQPWLTQRFSLLRYSASGSLRPKFDAKAAWVANLLVSLVFALLHLGQGPPPAALFCFSLALGYLRLLTGRLWPSIFLHMALNATSMMMAIAMIAKQAKQ